MLFGGCLVVFSVVWWLFDGGFVVVWWRHGGSLVVV